MLLDLNRTANCFLKNYSSFTQTDCFVIMSLRITSHASHLASTASSKLPLYTTTSILCLHFLLISLPLQLHIAEAKSGENTGCSFARDGCTYNIYLSQGELEEDALGESLRSVQLKESKLPCGQASKKVVLEDQVQNDYSAKLDNMEKNFSFLKDAHEQRLKVRLCGYYYDWSAFV